MPAKVIISDLYSHRTIIWILQCFATKKKPSRAINGLEEFLGLDSFRSKIKIRRIIRHIALVLEPSLRHPPVEDVDLMLSLVRNIGPVHSLECLATIHKDKSVFLLDQDLSEILSDSIVDRFYSELQKQFGSRLIVVRHPRVRTPARLNCESYLGIASIPASLINEAIFISVYSTSLLDVRLINAKFRSFISASFLLNHATEEHDNKNLKKLQALENLVCQQGPDEKNPVSP